MAYNNKKLFWLLLIIFLVLGLFCFELFFRPIPAASVISKNSHLKTGIIDLKDNKLRVEIADNNRERYLGLSGYKNLCEDCGMLFNFETKEKQNFVMRNMNFPLDIIFLNDGRIINIASNVIPEGSNPSKIYSSYGEVNLVLEVNGGYCAAHNISAGDSIKNLELD